MNFGKTAFLLLSLLSLICHAVFPQGRTASSAKTDPGPVREVEVSIRFLVEGVALKETVNDSVWSDLQRSLVLEDTAGSRLSAHFGLERDRLVTTLQLRPETKLRPKLIDSEFFAFDSSRAYPDFDFPGKERKVIRLPVVARLKTLNIKFENGSPEKTLCARYPGIFADVIDRASRELILKKRLSPTDAVLVLQCSGGKVFIPAYLFLDREHYDVGIKPNPTVKGKTISLGGLQEDSLHMVLVASEERITITPLDPYGNKFKSTDMPKLSIRHKDVEVKGNAREAGGAYSAVMVPGLSYEFSLSHKYFEYGPREYSISGGQDQLRFPTRLRVDLYAIQLTANGPFIRGRLPDSIICSSDGKNVVASFSSALIAIPKIFELQPPINIGLRAGDSDNWRLAGRDLQPGRPNRVSIERVLNKKASVSFRIAAPTDIPAQRLRVSVVAEGLSSEWNDLRVPLNESMKASVTWPQKPLDSDTIRITVEKPTGIGVNDDQRWQSVSFDTTVKCNGADEIQLKVHRLPPFMVLYVDLTQDNIDRGVLLERLNGHLSEIDKRVEVRDCYLWLSNGVDRSYGYFDRARTIINGLTRLEPLVQDFYNEIRKITDEFSSTCQVLRRVVPEYHLYLSESTFKWIRADVQTLTKRLKEVGLAEDQVTFYVQTDQKVDKALGRYRVINLASTSK